MASPKGGAKVLILTGAPSLDEVTSDDFLDVLLPEFRRFVRNETHNPSAVPTPSRNWPNWRRLVIDGKDRQLRETQTGQTGVYDAATPAVHSQPNLGEVDYEFLRHSLAVFEDNQQDCADGTEVSFDESTFLDDTTLTDFAQGSPLMLHADKTAAQITNLRNLPHSTTIERSYPQTITVNLLVSIISIMPARTVKPRAFRRTMQLTEVIVGDETRSNFAITFWAQATTSKYDNKATQDQRAAIQRLRPKQIVLIANVALRV